MGRIEKAIFSYLNKKREVYYEEFGAYMHKRFKTLTYEEFGDRMRARVSQDPKQREEILPRMQKRIWKTNVERTSPRILFCGW